MKALDANGVNEHGVAMCECGNKRIHAWEPGESCSPQRVVPEPPATKTLAAEWAEKIAADYQAQVERGEHDEKCEYDVRGFYLCHCSKRRREAKGFTEPPTERLEFPPPTCPRCDEDLIHEEGWHCNRCSLSWDSDGDSRSARFTDEFGDDLAGDAERWRSTNAGRLPATPESTEEGE